MSHRYEFGRGMTSVTAGNGSGSTKKISKGHYLLTISGETVEITVGQVTTATGLGTPLVVGTQILIRVEEQEDWAFFSSSGAGIVKFTVVQ